MRAAVLSVLLASLLLASPARAEIYRWVDARGSVNFDDDITRGPEDQRASMKVFQSKAKAAPPPAADDGKPTQAAFARALAQDLGLLKHENQDPVSVLQVVGVYPAIGWHPAAALVPAAVDEVVRATIAAARARRLTQSPGSAEASVLRVAGGLGVQGPPPSIAPEPPPPPPEPAPIVFAPNIIVEAPPVVVEQVTPAAASGYFIGTTDPAFAFGVPFRSLRPSSSISTPLLPRIPPNPAGQLRGSAIEPLGGSAIVPLGGSAVVPLGGPVVQPFHARSRR